MSGVGKPRGRPTLFTPVLGREICVRMEHVGFEAVVAESVGVHRETLATWRKRGEAGDEAYADFARELLVAKARWVERQLNAVDDPKWKLERLDRALFSTTQRHEHTGRDGAAIEHGHKRAHSLSREQSLEIVSKVLGVRRELVEGKFRGAPPESAVAEPSTSSDVPLAAALDSIHPPGEGG